LDSVGRNEATARITKALCRMTLFPFFCLETAGKENLPKKSAFILLPKHQRWEDIPLLSLATPRSLYYIAKHELFRNPAGNWFMRSVGGIPINRDRPLESRRSLKKIIEHLRKEEGVVVFPEGTYFRDQMGPGHAGIVRLILSRLTLPFIPVGISYSGDGPRKTVRIRFGQAVFGDSSVPAKEFLDHMMKKIAQLSGLS